MDDTASDKLWPAYIEMTVEQWLSVPDNPRQRDTEHRLVKAKSYLANPLPIHRFVCAAQLPDGRLVKVDGHTRAALWAHDLIPRPESVACTIIPVDDLEQAAALYWACDTPEASKQLKDYLFGTLKASGRVIKAKWVEQSIGGALALLEGMSSVRNVMDEAIEAWWHEIEWVCQQPPPLEIARRAPVLAGIMASGCDDLVTGFMVALSRGGTQIAGARDGVSALVHALELRRLAKRTSGNASRCYDAGLTVAAIDAYRRGQYCKSLRARDWHAIVAKVARLRPKDKDGLSETAQHSHKEADQPNNNHRSRGPTVCRLVQIRRNT